MKPFPYRGVTRTFEDTSARIGWLESILGCGFTAAFGVASTFPPSASTLVPQSLQNLTLASSLEPHSVQNFIAVYPPGVVADSVGVGVGDTFEVVTPVEVDAPVGVEVGEAFELSEIIVGLLGWNPLGQSRLAAITFGLAFPVLL